MSASPSPSIDCTALATVRVRFAPAAWRPGPTLETRAQEPDARYLRQQRTILASRVLLLRAVHAAGLNTTVRALSCADTVRAAEFATHGEHARPACESLRITHAAAARSIASPRRLRLLMLSSNQYELWSGATWLGLGSFDLPFVAQDLRLTISQRAHRTPASGDSYEIELSPLHLAVQRTRARLSISCASSVDLLGGAAQLELSYQDESMVRAREFLRALLVAFTDWRREQGDESFAVTASFAPARAERTADLRELSAHLNALIGAAPTAPRTPVQQAEPRVPPSPSNTLHDPPRRTGREVQRGDVAASQPVLATPTARARADRELDALIAEQGWFAPPHSAGKLAAGTPQPFFRDAARTSTRSAVSESGVVGDSDRELLARLLEEPARQRRRWLLRGGVALGVAAIVRILLGFDVGAAAAARPGRKVEVASVASSPDPRPVVVPMQIDEPLSRAAPLSRPPRLRAGPVPRTVEGQRDVSRRVRKPGRSRADDGVINEFGPDDFEAVDGEGEIHYVLPPKAGPLPLNPY